jgi:metal transporter CNNM
MGVCDPLYPPGSWDFWITLLSTCVCIIGAATAAGLTMGLISLDEMDLAVLLEANEADCRSESERRELCVQQAHARKVWPLVSRHHQLLVTLLLLNSLANESLPLFLDSLVPSWLAIALSVTMLLIFAEIVPSAIFTGPGGLGISAQLSPLVYFAMVVCSPVALPISWVLDRWLGQHGVPGGQRYNKSQLLALLRLHTDDALASPAVGVGPWEEDDDGRGRALDAPARGLARNEVRMMQGAMAMHHVTARDCMTAAEDMFMLDGAATKLDMGIMAQIVYQGRSRIPVFRGSRDHIVGVLLTKKLTAVSPDDARALSSMSLRQPLFVSPETTLSQILREMRLSKSHMAIVCNRPADMARAAKSAGPFSDAFRVYGCITLLDLVQRLVDERLDDEDHHSPRRGAASVPSPATAADEARISVLAAGRLRAWAQRAKARRLEFSSVQAPFSNSEHVRISPASGDQASTTPLLYSAAALPAHEFDTVDMRL